jgi:hypothetical protein
MQVYHESIRMEIAISFERGAPSLFVVHATWLQPFQRECSPADCARCWTPKHAAVTGKTAEEGTPADSVCGETGPRAPDSASMLSQARLMNGFCCLKAETVLTRAEPVGFTPPCEAALQALRQYHHGRQPFAL